MVFAELKSEINFNVFETRFCFSEKTMKLDSLSCANNQKHLPKALGGKRAQPLNSKAFLFMIIWKDVKGFEGWYQISNYGDLRSIDRIVPYPNGPDRRFKGRVQAKSYHKKGYVYYDLYKNCKKKRFFAHVLVYQAFKEDYDPKPDINHIDCDKKNNFIGNLEQVTRSENMIHALKNGLLKNTVDSATKHYIKDIDGSMIDLKEFSKKYNLSYSKVLARFNKGYSFEEIIIERKYSIEKYRREKSKLTNE